MNSPFKDGLLDGKVAFIAGGTIIANRLVEISAANTITATKNATTMQTTPAMSQRPSRNNQLDVERMRQAEEKRQMRAAKRLRSMYFAADVGAPPGAGFGVNVFLRHGDTVYRTWHTAGRGTEQLEEQLGALLSEVLRPDRTPARIARIFAAHDGKCHVCRRKLRPGDDYDIDHVLAQPFGSLPELIALQATRQPDHTALILDEHRLSYAALREGMDRVAASLQRDGLGPGDVLAIWPPIAGG